MVRRILCAAMIVVALAVCSSAAVYVSSPANGSTVASPAHFVASATSSYPISAMRIYVDGVSAYTVNSNKLDTYVSMSPGWHSVVIQAWDSKGTVQKQSLNVNVSGTAVTKGVTVISPSNGATVTSPARFIASARSTSPIVAMRIYVDSNSVYSTNSASLDTNISLSAGAHNVVVQAWDSTGAVFKSPLTLNVSATTGPVIPAGAKTFTNIDEMTGWDSCDKCSGANANGPTTPYKMTQFISSPSLDGKSAQFWVGGDTPYASALWWKQLGANPAPRHFVYDLYFYIKDPLAPQALEFDANQSISPYRYIMGTECSLRNSKQWSVWDGATKHWMPTGVPCTYIEPYKWHHLVEEFERTTDGKVRYISITLDGKKNYINRTYAPQYIGSGNDVNVAIQLDGNYAMQDYMLWADKITFTYW
ncbi:MAG TPA: Ig-like domain-containing protein [Terriglobales bacterium]|nr:Ig-like domain-containing protein [Terriglobales bacterium]